MTDFSFFPEDVSTGIIELGNASKRTDEELVEWIVGVLKKYSLCDRRVVFCKSSDEDNGWWSSRNITPRLWSEYRENKKDMEVCKSSGIWTVPLLLGGIYGERVKVKYRCVENVELRTGMELKEGSVISDFKNYILDKQWRKGLRLSSKTQYGEDPIQPDDFNWLQRQRFDKILKAAGGRLQDALYEIIPRE